MKKGTISLLLAILILTGQAQSINTCYNGKKDSTEDGVDCYIGKRGCMPCNGNANITFDGKAYQTGVNVTHENQMPSSGGFIDNSTAGFIFQSQFFTEGTPLSGFTLIFSIRGRVNKPTTFKINSLTRGPLSFVIRYHRSGGILTIHKIKEGTFSITSVNPSGRKLSASYKVLASLSDGTDIDLTGDITDIEY